MGNFDVAILGAGPAGSARALSLARDGARVVVFERTRFEQPRWGETVGPEVRPLLERLGAWQAFLDRNPLPCQTVYSAWGGEDLIEQPAIYHPLGGGWHVDRNAVDAMLATLAANAGATVLRDCGYCRISRRDALWTVSPTEGEPASAPLLIDASGRGAPATAGQIPARRWERFDRLVAISATLRHSFPDTAEIGLCIEAAEDGWWYAAPLPGRRLVATYLTDADLLSAGREEDTATFWRNALGKTRHIAQIVVQTDGFDGKPVIRAVRAESGISHGDGDGLIAIGDASFARDPLSGSGFLHALQSSLEPAGKRPDATDYLAQRARYYSMERRWATSEFWRRRQPA